MKFRNLFGYFVLALLAIGLIVTIIHEPFMIIIPVAVFGAIYYFVKRPAAFMHKNNQKTAASKYRKAASITNKQSKAKKASPRSKTVPFKVIEGGRDDNDTPRYH